MRLLYTKFWKSLTIRSYRQYFFVLKAENDQDTINIFHLWVIEKQQHFYLKQIFCLEILISACFLADILLDLRAVSVSF